MTRWYEKQMRILHASLWMPPERLSTLDLAQFAQDVEGAQYNAQHLEHAKGWDGRAHLLFQTEEEPDLLRDVVGEYLPEAHQRGIQVFIYMNVHSAGRQFITEHPNWIQRKIDRSPLTGLYGGPGTSWCVNTSWRDWVFGLIEDLARQYPIDGIFFDGPCFYLGTCYCDACRAKFDERYALDILTIEDKHSPHWPEFIEFRYDSIAAFLRDGNAALKRHKPDAPLYMNANGLHSGALNGRDNRRLIEHQDILGAEGGFMFYGRPSDVPLWKVSATAKFLEAQAGGKPTVIFTATGHKPWEYPLTGPEIRLNTAATFACGANPWLGCHHHYLQDPSMRAVSEELAFFAQHEEILSGTVARSETALLWSTPTADYYGTHLPEIDFMVEKPEAAEAFDFQTSFNGGYEALMRSGVPFQIVDEVGVERGDLGSLKSLLIADAACMSEATAEGIRDFVRKGGQVIATGHTSLYDERGHPRPDYLLSDVFGCQYVGPRGLSSWELLWMDGTYWTPRGIERTDLPSPRYQIQVTALEGAEVVARYYAPTPSRYAPQPALTEDPAIAFNRYGEGTSLYLAGDWAKHYWTYRIDECLEILSSLARQEPPVQLEAPTSCVEVTWRVHPDSGDHFIHLLNYTGEMERPIKAIAPLDDVAVRLRTDREPRQVEALRAETRLAFQREGEHVVILLGRLTHHEVVRIQW